MIKIKLKKVRSADEACPLYQRRSGNVTHKLHTSFLS